VEQTTQLNLRIPLSVKQRAMRAALADRRTLTSFIVKLLDDNSPPLENVTSKEAAE
jgi:predicted HicB family RNase H-like nuclease